VSLPKAAQDYCESALALGAVREWCEGARREKEFVQADEPYATK